MRQPLRVGILLRASGIEAWALAMVDEISRSDYARIEVLLEGDGTIEKRGAGRNRVGDNSKLVRRLFSKLDDKLFQPVPDAFERRPAREVLPDRPVVPLVAEGNALSAEALERIEKLNLDVLIDVNFGVTDGPLLEAAKYGLWACNRAESRGTEGVREVLEREAETVVSIQMRRDLARPDLMLAHVYAETDRLSPKRNRNRYHWKAASLFARTLKALWELGETDFFRRVRLENARSVFYSGPAKEEPGNLRMAVLVVRLYWRKVIGTVLRLLRREPWALFYQVGCDELSWRSLFRLQSIVPPGDRFWADPHVVEHQGKHHVFLEEYIYTRRRGHISVLEIDGAGRYTQPRVVLEADHHLAYPFVFQHAGRFYMIPETRAKRRIELYRCVSFPDRWELATVLIDNVDAVDATVLLKDGKWWLFANIRESPGMSLLDELFLFYSDDLFEGDWIPHPKNPIVADVRGARPAGRLFEIDGELYRPAQKCSPRYGYGIVIKRVNEMTECLYEEEPVVMIEPKWNRRLVATHTINIADGVMVMDGRLRRWRWTS